MPRIDLTGASIYYELSGNSTGSVLMFSNSLGTTLDMWAPQLDEFERQFRVLRYDMRGHGKSLTPPGPYSIELLASDVLALLNALEIQRVHFCGLSIGGVIGQWLGIHAASRLRKLVLCNTAARIGNADTWNSRIATVQQDGMNAIVDGAMGRWFTAPFLASNAPVLASMRQMLAATDPAGYIASCAAIRDVDLREHVASIKCPTLLIAGQYDIVTTLSDAQFLQDHIPGAALATLPAAHISNAEVPEQFNPAVLKFLTQDGVE